MSQLSNKINSYTHEMGIEFNQAYTLNPTFTGTNAPTVTPYFILTGTAPTFESNIGPIGGAGSWKYTQTSGSTSTQMRTNTTNVTSTWADGNWSSGVWIKFNSLPTGTGSTAVHALLPASAAPGFVLSITGSSHATNPSKFASNLVSTTAWTGGFGPTIQVNRWYYVAHRKTTTSTTAQVWIDGALILTGNNTSTGSSSSGQFGGSGTASVSLSYNISNWYVGTAAQITSTEIAEIWTAGSTGPGVTITETPATATALQTEPTIVVSGANHTEVTTSILVNAIMVDIFSVSAEYNFTHQETAVYNLTAEFVEPEVDTNIGTSFSPLPMTASAEMAEIVLTIPLTASAEMVEPSNIYTNPSYFKLVKALNPIFYIHDGKRNTPPTVNDGSETFGTITFPASITSVNGGTPMNYTGEGLSWYNSLNSSSDRIIVNGTGTSGRTALQNMWTNGNFTTEFWYKRTTPSELNINLYNDGFISLQFDGADTNNDGFDDSWGIKLDVIGGAGYYVTGQVGYSSSNILNLNQWHHFVIRSTKTGSSNPQIALFINGSAVASMNYVASSEIIQNAGTTISYRPVSTGYMDQMAIYNYALTNSNILDNYSFIHNYDPNVQHYAYPLTANATLADAAYQVTSDINYPESPVTASGLIVQPSVIAQINNSIFVDPMTASAQNTDATVYWGWTIYTTPATAYAEKPATYFLNDLYYQYVQTNFAPYRYVTFDSADATLDYGTDTDYSVTHTTIGGEVVNPDLGINGKSVKTTGNSYVTDGVILNESEWNDDWGTGNNDYISSFWMQRALDDASTTGLRVLWNLNGHHNNQHVVVYHYQNKLHFQINNQSGTHHTVTSANNVNIFDYNRHHIVIYSHFNNNHNYISIYVDGVSIIGAVDIGNYKITTVNATSADSGPNSESNNYARMSVGCLITPFGSTALPVAPTNTKLIVDEIFWDKDSITAQQAMNLYAAMPDKANKLIVATPLTASDELVMPAISTNAILSSSALTASSEFINPAVTADRNIINTSLALEASALMPGAFASQNNTITSDIFIATATFNSAGVIISIPGGPMLANAILKHGGNYMDPYNLLILKQSKIPHGVSFNARWSVGDIDS